MGPPPLLALADARIDAPGDGPLTEGWTGTGAGPRVGLYGAWSPLFRLFAGEARLAAGSAEVGGVAAERAARAGLLGIARAGAPLPGRWRGVDYVVEGARLGGLGREAAERARGTLERLGLGRLGQRPIRGLSPVERRALAVAQAAVTPAPLLALEDPLDALEPNAAAALRVVIERASEGRELLVSSRWASPGSEARGLLEACTTVLTLGPRGEVAPLDRTSLPAGSGSRWELRVLGGAERLAVALAEGGAAIEERQLGLEGFEPSAGSRAAEPGVATGPIEPGGRLVVRLPSDADASLVLRTARELDCALVEFTPVTPGTASEREPRRTSGD